MKILSLFTRSLVIPNPNDLLSSVEYKQNTLSLFSMFLCNDSDEGLKLLSIIKDAEAL